MTQNIPSIFQKSSQRQRLDLDVYRKTLAFLKASKTPSQVGRVNQNFNLKFFDSTRDNFKTPYKCTVKRIHTHFRSIISDQVRRGRFEIQELQHTILKGLFYSQPINTDVTLTHFGLLGFTSLANPYKSRGGSLSQIRNRCILSGRAQTLNHLRLSRIQIRLQAGYGKIPGLIKR